MLVKNHYNPMLGNFSPWVSCVSAVLQAGALTVLALEYLSKDMCTANGFGRQRWCLPLEQSTGWFIAHCDEDNVSLWDKGKTCLLPTIKDVVSLSSRFLSVYAAITWAYSHQLARTGVWRNGTNADTPATTIAMSNKIHCLWPWSFMSCAPIHKIVAG